MVKTKKINERTDTEKLKDLKSQLRRYVTDKKNLFGKITVVGNVPAKNVDDTAISILNQIEMIVKQH